MNRRAFLSLPLAAKVLSQTLYKSLYASLERIPTFDTHEHFPSEAQRVKQGVDFFTLAGHYAMNDVVSAGLPQDALKQINDANVPVGQKWAVFEPFWKYARSTGYGQALIIAIRDIYGFGEISARTVGKIDGAIKAQNKPGIYRDIMGKRAGVVHCLNDAVVDPADAPLLLPARRFDHLVQARDLKLVEKLTNTSIGSLADLARALEGHVARAVKDNMVSIKSAFAYSREIRFADVPESEAAAAFARNPASREVVDYMFHHLMRVADSHRVPVQIHTGLLAGNRPELEQTHPRLLTNVLTKYPRVQFDLFHIGYPYHHEIAVTAKHLPNVHVDFCWAHIISPSVARSALHEMLDTVPANKLMGFGGDYRYPELSYAHLVMARRNIATVLAERVQAGASTEADAADIGRWLLHDNPAALFTSKRER